jgi:hypothetical protein
VVKFDCRTEGQPATGGRPNVVAAARKIRCDLHRPVSFAIVAERAGRNRRHAFNSRAGRESPV